jgi:hypothetical protein
MAPSITAADCSTDRSDLVLKLTNAVFKTGDPKLLKDIPEDCKVLIKVLIKVLKKVQAASLPSPQLAAAEEAADKVPADKVPAGKPVAGEATAEAAEAQKADSNTDTAIVTTQSSGPDPSGEIAPNTRVATNGGGGNRELEEDTLLACAQSTATAAAAAAKTAARAAAPQSPAGATLAQTATAGTAQHTQAPGHARIPSMEDFLAKCNKDGRLPDGWTSEIDPRLKPDALGTPGGKAGDRKFYAPGVTKDTKQPGKWAKTRKAAWLISAGYVKSQYECDMIFSKKRKLAGMTGDISPPPIATAPPALNTSFVEF